MSVRTRSNGSDGPRGRRRPAPRKNAGQSGAGRIQWDRLGRIALVVTVFVLGALYLGPAYNFVKTYRQAGQAKAEYHRVADENQRLERLAKRARSDLVLRREARRQGMIVPGEQAYVVSGLKR